MARTDGFLTRGIAWFRLYTDEPAVNVKYTDANIIVMLESAYKYILDSINRAMPMGKNIFVPVQTYADVEMGDPDDEQRYSLPPYMGQLIVVKHLSSDSDVLGTVWSRGTYHPGGKGIRIEQDTLWVGENMFPEGDFLRFEYVPSGCAALHEGTATAVAADGSTITLAATATLGELDTHPHAYAGARVRVLSATGAGAANNYVQERTIASYAHTTRVATLNEPFSPVPAGAVITYEIAPITDQVMDRAIWLHATLDVMAVEDSPHYYKLRDRMRTTMRDIRLGAGQRDLQSGGKVERSRFRDR